MAERRATESDRVTFRSIPRDRPVHACNECDALVADPDRHRAWHDRLAAASPGVARPTGRGVKRLAAKNAALVDQIIAVLRNADGFPMSTGAIASECGQHLVTFGSGHPPALPRPSCWPDDVEDDPCRRHSSARCERCNRFHRQPVWRSYDAQDVRGLLNRLAKEGEIEKVVLDSQRNHYWRREDTDA